MKRINMKYFFAVAVLALAAAGCKDADFDSRKIQSVDSHGVDQNMISTAVTPTSSSEFLASAVDASADEMEIQLIPVVITSAGTASQDIHVTMVPDPDALASYNSDTFDEHNDTTGEVTVPHPELYYIMPGDAGTPAFTLVDDGVVTIPKGSQVGYLKIRTVTADYFGDITYAYSYKIESVKEGYPISGNHNFGIVAVIPKNKYDGTYDMSIITSGWSAYGIADGPPARDYGNTGFVTTSLTSNVLSTPGLGPLQPAFSAAGGKTGFGATGPSFVFDSNDKIIDVFNTAPDDGRGRAFSLNPAAGPSDNLYDPATKTIYANYLMHQNGRPDQTIIIVFTYVGPR